tara:strand:- start:16902 stop:17114 length:213 start_codon:yes stop_codon:yes gene_type:complete
VKIKKNNLIQFVNFVNECCQVMNSEYVADWLNKPHPDLNMESPMDLINDETGREKLYRLLYFIEINEADL